MQCVYGDYASYLLAKVKVVIEGKSYFVEAAVMKKLPTSVLLGRDVPEPKRGKRVKPEPEIGKRVKPEPEKGKRVKPEPERDKRVKPEPERA